MANNFENNGQEGNARQAFGFGFTPYCEERWEIKKVREHITLLKEKMIKIDKKIEENNYTHVKLETEYSDVVDSVKVLDNRIRHYEDHLRDNNPIQFRLYLENNRDIE